MTLVERMRGQITLMTWGEVYDLMREAADRIEELEAALRSTAEGYHNEHQHTLGDSFTDCMWSLCYEARGLLEIEGRNTANTASAQQRSEYDRSFDGRTDDEAAADEMDAG